MDVAARVTSKGQITIPKDVRDALGIEEGDRIVFRVQKERAVMAKTPDLLDLAGTVEVPAAMRDASWENIRGAARRHRAEAHR